MYEWWELIAIAFCRWNVLTLYFNEIAVMEVCKNCCKIFFKSVPLFSKYISDKYKGSIQHCLIFDHSFELSISIVLMFSRCQNCDISSKKINYFHKLMKPFVSYGNHIWEFSKCENLLITTKHWVSTRFQTFF